MNERQGYVLSMTSDSNSQKETFDSNEEGNQQDLHESSNKIGPESEILRKLESELELEKGKSSEISKRILYLQADLINFQRQTERKIEDAKTETAIRFVESMVSIKEDLERALFVVTSSKDASHTLVEGLRMLASRVDSVLKGEQVQRIAVSEDSPFDIRFHEAVSYSETSGMKEGNVVSVVSNGYTMKGKVIRPALVEVARTSSGDSKGVMEKKSNTSESGDDASSIPEKNEP